MKGDSALNHPLAGYSPCSKMSRRKENILEKVSRANVSSYFTLGI